MKPTLTLLLVVVAFSCPTELFAESASPSPCAVQAAFSPLKFGDIKPRGWILAQMRRDLQSGFAGCLDELCHEAASDIFATGRNRLDKPNVGNAASDAWWNGETEGNWHCGHIMLACLTGDAKALAKAKSYIDHLLAAQDADGYLGIFSPELRYKGNGELWTQTCLFRGLLAYAEATGDERVFTAVKRAVDRTIAGYADCKSIQFTIHDAMYTDVLEPLYAKTGDKKYLDFGLRIYRECPNLRKFHEQPEVGNVFQSCYGGGHGATVAESMRIPFWLWEGTGDSEFLRLGLGVVSAMDRWILPSGALVSEENVSLPPHSWNAGYEYCTVFEREFTLIQAGQKTGDSADFEAIEHLWFNAAQGLREPNGSAILYCSYENRLSIHDEISQRQRFSPTHQQVAVCCNPNATRVAPYFIANAWMRPNRIEPSLAATLYGPCEVKTEIADTPIRIEEQTDYPYSGDVEIAIHPARPVAFCLWLRNPQWSKETKIVCPGADIRQVGGFWQVRKQWKEGDTIAIHFDQTIREVPAINSEVAIQYGPLLYVLPVRGEMQTVRTYDKPGFKDYHVSLAKGADAKLGLLPDKRAAGFGFVPKAVEGTAGDFPLDNPPVVLEGSLLRTDDTVEHVTLVPMGARNTQLRRVTFPIGNGSRIMTGFEAEKAKKLGAANVYADPAASGASAVGFIGHIGDGIEFQSSLLTGQQLKIRYAALNKATLTLEIEGKRQKVTFPATGAWSGDYAYSYVTVDVLIPEKVTVKLFRDEGDGAVNLDVLAGAVNNAEKP
jgi:hypothetical protein